MANIELICNTIKKADEQVGLNPVSPFKTAMDAYLNRHSIPNAPQKEPTNAK